jgi:hypothetical protein
MRPILPLGQEIDGDPFWQSDQLQMILPLAPGQLVPDSGADLEIAKAMHPAQLKIQLLLDPEVATALLEQLNRIGE